jgi:flagellar biosynthesis protein
MKDKDKNKPPKAVALKWDGKAAPRVTAKGQGALAEQILALAREYEIPIQEDNEVLVSALAQIELGDEIPETLYVAVAQVIAFAYYLSGKQSVMGDTEI